MTHILIRIQAAAPGPYPDFAKTFDTIEAARAELSGWTDPMKDDPTEYWTMPVVVHRTPDNTIINDFNGALVQRYDILPHMDGI